jgi:hypothetical protein
MEKENRKLSKEEVDRRANEMVIPLMEEFIYRELPHSRAEEALRAVYEERLRLALTTYSVSGILRSLARHELAIRPEADVPTIVQKYFQTPCPKETPTPSPTEPSPSARSPKPSPSSSTG